MEGLGENNKGAAAEFLGLGYNTMPQQPFFLKKASLSQEKKTMTPPCRKTSHSLRKTPSPILWNPACPTWHLYYFLPTCILSPAKEGAT